MISKLTANIILQILKNSKETAQEIILNFPTNCPQPNCECDNEFTISFERHYPDERAIVAESFMIENILSICPY